MKIMEEIVKYVELKFSNFKKIKTFSLSYDEGIKLRMKLKNIEKSNLRDDLFVLLLQRTPVS